MGSMGTTKPPLPEPLSRDTDTMELILQLVDTTNQIIAYLQTLEP